MLIRACDLCGERAKCSHLATPPPDLIRLEAVIGDCVFRLRDRDSKTIRALQFDKQKTVERFVEESRSKYVKMDDA